MTFLNWLNHACGLATLSCMQWIAANTSSAHKLLYNHKFQRKYLCYHHHHDHLLPLILSKLSSFTYTFTTFSSSTTLSFFNASSSFTFCNTMIYSRSCWSDRGYNWVNLNVLHYFLQRSKKILLIPTPYAPLHNSKLITLSVMVCLWPESLSEWPKQQPCPRNYCLHSPL